MRSLLVLLVVACGGGGGSATDGAPAGPDADLTPPAEACGSPVTLADTSSPTAVIGAGTPESCTEADLRAAAAAGAAPQSKVITPPATIALTAQIVLPIDRDTTIDGGGLVTLDAGQVTRHFFFEHPDWMNNPTRVVLQRLTLRNGRAPAGAYFPQDPANPRCAYGYKEGSGGAIYMRNGVLHVIDCVFVGNEAALVGPDVGGGAIYVLGVPEVVISGSRFTDNHASNGGAVGMLFANPAIYNSVFEGNSAQGSGANYVEPGCPEFNHPEQGGAGGNSGAVYFDGMNDDGVTFTICGAVFRDNHANELGGALFRTPNVTVRDMRIEASLFDGNTARLGGVSFIKQNDLVVRASTFVNNSATGVHGGLWVNEGTADVENSTFGDNAPSGLIVDGPATVRNATFSASALLGDDLTVTNSLLVDQACPSPLGGDHNLAWPDAACAPGATVADPLLGALADHGGPTPTYLPAGPVQGIGAACPPFDQRGEPRDVATCAAGAVEP